jgi:hypothetical protein
VKRTTDPRSKGVVRVTLTQAGLERLDALAAIHVRELTHLGPTVRVLWQALEGAAPTPGSTSVSCTRPGF